jgi:hypothetical protein
VQYKSTKPGAQVLQQASTWQTFNGTAIIQGFHLQSSIAMTMQLNTKNGD